MAEKTTHNTSFNNPDPVNVLNAIKTINAINQFIVDNDLSKHFKEISQNIKQIKVMLADFNDLSTYLQKIDLIKSSAVSFIDTLQYIDDYVDNSLSDFAAIDNIRSIIESFINVFTIDIDVDKFNQTKKLNKNLSNIVFDLMSDLYYIGVMTTANEEKVNDGLNLLIGENTSAYLPILNSNYNFEASNNNSILYKYFLLNEILARASEVKFAKMGWFKRFIFFNFTIKGIIKRIINTITYFYKQTDKIAKVMDEGDKAIEQVSTRATGAFVLFSNFIDQLMDKSYGMKKTFEAKSKIRAIVGLYRYFLKQLIRLAKDFQKYSRVKPRKGITIMGHNFFGREEGYISLDILEPVSNVIESIFTAVQTAEAASKIGFWQARKAKKRIKKILQIIITIPKTITEVVNKDSIESANDIITNTTDFIETLIKIANDVAAIEYTSNGDKQIRKFVKSLYGTKKHPGIIREINSIDKRSLDSSAERIAVIKNIFDGISAVINSVKGMTSAAINLSILSYIVLPLIQNLIISISKVKIPKNSEKKAEKIRILLTTITGVITGVILSLTMVAGFGFAAMIGFTVAMAMITSYIIGFYGLYNLLVKFDPKGNKTKLVEKRLTAIAGIISGFGMVMSRASAEFGGLIVSIMIIMGAMMLFVQEFVFISKKLDKNEQKLEKGEKMLAVMGGAMAAFGAAMKSISTNSGKKVDTSVYLAILILAGVVAEIVGIMWLLSKTEKVTKKGAIILLYSAGVLLSFIGIMLVLSMAVFTANVMILLSLALITAIVGGIVYLCYLVGNKNNAKNILIGLGIILLIAGSYLLIAYTIASSYELITNIDWAAFGFFYANIAAMLLFTIGIGFILTKFEQAVLAAVAGAAVIIAIALMMNFVGEQMGIMYGYIGGITNWEAFGFLFANIGAMAVAAGAIGAVMMTGVGAVAIAAGVATLIGISLSFVQIGANVATLYNVLPRISSEEARKRMQVLIEPMDVVCGFFSKDNFFKVIINMAKTASAMKSFVGISENLSKIATNLFSVDLNGKEKYTEVYKSLFESILTVANADQKSLKSNFESSNKFIDKINTVKVENLRTAANMFEKMAEFSKSISGNFEGLADTINDKIMPLLEQLNEGLNKTNENIGNNIANIPVMTTPTTVVAPTSTTTSTSPGGSAPAVPQKDYSRILGEIKQEIAKVQKTLTDGSQITNIESR